MDFFAGRLSKKKSRRATQGDGAVPAAAAQGDDTNANEDIAGTGTAATAPTMGIVVSPNPPNPPLAPLGTLAATDEGRGQRVARGSAMAPAARNGADQSSVFHRPLDPPRPSTAPIPHSTQFVKNPLQRRRAASGTPSLAQPKNGQNGHDLVRSSRRLGRPKNGQNGHVVVGSSRRVGAAPASLQYSTKPNGLLMFRIVTVIIIIFCMIWGYLLIKIASDIDYPKVQPMRSLARPYSGTPSGISRMGRMIRQKINHVQLKLRPVPLLDVGHMDSPILIFTYNRADYLERTLWKVFEHHPAQSQHHLTKTERYTSSGDLRGTTSKQDRKGMTSRLAGAPIIISQDGRNSEVEAVIDIYSDLFEMKLGVPLFRIVHPRVAETSTGYDFYAAESTKTYKLLALHYGWALEQTFSGAAYNNGQRHNRVIPTPPLPQRVIILEEDIEIAPDFFSFMNSTADLLDSDETLLAVSAFNDNGKKQFVADSERLVRSDFFPGLGWMMSRTVWDGPPSHPSTGLKNNWAPNGFWDDWLRDNSIRWGRQVIRPEVSRTFHFGNMHGASEGQDLGILNEIVLDENNVHWEDQDLSYLSSSSFAKNYWNRVSRAKPVETVIEAKSYVAHSDVKLVYSNFKQFTWMAADFGVTQDEKAGVPRTGYEGIVEIRYGRGNFFIFLTPPYVTLGDKPTHFGMKAWMEYSKESLMQKLGIENVAIEDRPPLDWY